MAVINADRSDFTTNFFREVLGDNNVREFDLTRGIVVQGHMIPYATSPECWPDEIKDRLKINPECSGIHLGATRAEFSDAYGSWFANLVFDKMIEAYPTITWKREHGTSEEYLLDAIFPWFFPRTSLEQRPDTVDELGVISDESRLYHYERRHAEPPTEMVLYPKGSGGYAIWIHKMLEKAQKSFDVRTGLTDIQVDIDPESLDVHSVTAGEISYTADNVFWCAPLPVLCRVTGWRLPKGEPQWELLGSFTFNEPVSSDYHEILFADPEHKIRRINFPGLLTDDRHSTTLQVEYTTLGDEVYRDPEEWRKDWLDSLYRLGIIEEGVEPKYFDFKRVSRGIISMEDLGEFLADCEWKIKQANKNFVVPHLAVASDNNARLVPKVYSCIEEYINGESV